MCVPGDCRLSRLAQAFSFRFGEGVRHLFVKAPLLLVAVLPLAACASGGVDLSKADVDQSSLTGALPSSGATPDATRVSDEATIRNAVSSADPEQAKAQPLAWANADTGSRGAISSMLEKKENGVICRAFTASRESFDGVALYSGDACQGDRGNWFMRSFKPL
jgi:hypothetical protein